jgi:ribosomal protein S12 methylthiotransferase
MNVVVDRLEGEYYVARTEYDSPEVDPEVLIHVSNGRLRIGSFYKVEIIDSDDFDLYARRVK